MTVIKSVLSLMILLCVMNAQAAAQYSLYRRGIYIGKDELDKRHCFVQVLNWSPTAVKVKTKISTSSWSEELELKAATDEQNRTVFLKNPAQMSSDSLGVRYIKNTRVAVLPDAEGTRRCLALKLAN